VGVSAPEDVNGHGGAHGGGLAHLVGELVRRVLVQQNDDAVVLALIEHRVRRHHAMPGGDAFPLFDSHFHDVLFLVVMIATRPAHDDPAGAEAEPLAAGSGLRARSGLPAVVPPSTVRTVPVI
jgi:hypothetical protein